MGIQFSCGFIFWCAVQLRLGSLLEGRLLSQQIWALSFLKEHMLELVSSLFPLLDEWISPGNDLFLLFNAGPRSGLAWKHSIDVGAGVIDADYRGPVGVILFNHSDMDFDVKVGDRIAQLIIEKIMTPDVVEVEDLDTTLRGEGGFGSTGIWVLGICLYLLWSKISLLFLLGGVLRTAWLSNLSKQMVCLRIERRKAPVLQVVFKKIRIRNVMKIFRRNYAPLLAHEICKLIR